MEKMGGVWQTDLPNPGKDIKDGEFTSQIRTEMA
jgi:hypothetical protein